MSGMITDGVGPADFARWPGRGCLGSAKGWRHGVRRCSTRRGTRPTEPPDNLRLGERAPTSGDAIVASRATQRFRRGTADRRALPPARRLVRRTLCVQPGSSTSAWLLSSPRPGSVTGDDVVEFHLHGGMALVHAARWVRRSRARAGAPGAFTRRAFDNGKLDLGQVEALGDLIAAETVVQRRAALARTGNGLADRRSMAGLLVEVRADLEATLDFSEEDGVAAALGRRRARCWPILRDQLRTCPPRSSWRTTRDGVTVAIVGPVNAGKSTLLNALARSDTAIVSPQPGTTRDLIEVPVELAGMRVTLIDTAGIREAGDAIEAEGIRRGLARADDADLVIAFGPTNGRVRSSSSVRAI